MDCLPTELIGHICSFLDHSSLKSLRLSSKSFAIIAKDYLFHDFEFRLFPSHHRLYQLEQLAANPWIACRLKCLSFESGVQLEYADYRYWQAQVYHDKTSAWSRSLAAKGASRDAYERFHARLQARFTPDLAHRYDLYRWHLDQQAHSMADSRVRNILVRTMSTLSESCPSLQLKIVMSEPQISLEELEEFDPEEYASDKPYDPDPRRRVANRRQHCLDHFLNFLDAAQLSTCHVSDLIAVNMPHQLLTVNRLHGSDTLAETFRGLRILSIKISSFPHSDWLSRGGLTEVYFGGRNLAAGRLRTLLNRPANLETLSVEFPEGKEAEYSFELFDQTNLDRFPRLWLPHLKALNLCHFRCTWEDLQAMFKEAKNIQSLILRNCRLETGSMLDLLHFLPTMRLQQADVLGIWYVDDDFGQWHSHTKDDFTDCNAATSYDGPYAATGLRSKVQRFLLKGGGCPLLPWNAEVGGRNVWEVLGDTSWHYLPGLQTR